MVVSSAVVAPDDTLSVMGTHMLIFLKKARLLNRFLSQVASRGSAFSWFSQSLLFPSLEHLVRSGQGGGTRALFSQHGICSLLLSPVIKAKVQPFWEFWSHGRKRETGEEKMYFLEGILARPQLLLL